MSLFSFRRLFFVAIAVLLCCKGYSGITRAAEPDFAMDVQPLLTKYCVGCHNEKEAEGGFACHEYASLMKGSKERVVIKASDLSESYLLKLLSGEEEPNMPPKDELQPSDAEIALIRNWILQGAKKSQKPLGLRERLKVAAVAVKHRMEPPISSMYRLNDERMVVLGRYNEVTLFDLTAAKTIHGWNEVIGKVTSIRPSADGKKIVIASGVAGVGGQISIIDLASRKIELQLEGHRDAIYSAILSPDEKMIASAGYDRKIILWDPTTKEPIRHLDGHNGPIYDLDFDSTGKLLASCSGDETIKVWNVATGVRLDTLSQAEAEQYSVRFSSDRKRIFAAGADRRIRIWRLISQEHEAINPMLHACFAHEKSIVAIRLSPDEKLLLTISEDQTIKLWDANDLTAVGEVGRVNDVPSDASWSKDGQEVTVATISGSVESFSVETMLAEHRKTILVRSKANSQNRNDRANIAIPLGDIGMGNESVPRVSEIEPNDSFDSAMTVFIPTEIEGKIFKDSIDASDEDYFAFDAKADQVWVLTSTATGSKPWLDSMIEIRDADHQPIVRTRLQAVRESYFTFRGKDSSNTDDFRVHRWEDMEINELLYCGGEVVKLWLYPRGPDSGFKVYPGSGKRQTYFDTTANSHALGEPAWIVRELAADESSTPNGLPVFPLYFENDDDSTRRSEKNSRLIFTPPKDGRYFVRLRDVRNQQGDEYGYKLAIRSQQQDYKLTSSTKELSIAPGSGGEFSVSVERIDDFDGKVDLKFEGLPKDVFVSQPFTIEAGQASALGTLFIPSDAMDIPDVFSFSIVGVANVSERQVERTIEKELSVKISKTQSIQARFSKSSDENSDDIEELVIRPGQTISTFVVVNRGKEKGDIAFGKEDCGRNLPHGVFVSNIGLSGLVVKPGENTREVFITAAPWVQNQTRPFFLKSTIKGTPTTKPILLRVEDH